MTGQYSCWTQDPLTSKLLDRGPLAGGSNNYGSQVVLGSSYDRFHAGSTHSEPIIINHTPNVKGGVPNVPYTTPLTADIRTILLLHLWKHRPQTASPICGRVDITTFDSANCSSNGSN